MDAHADTLPEDVFPCSTHPFGLREAVELGRVMNRLPQTLLIYGIEGKRFFSGAPPSPGVERAVVSLVERLTRRILGSLFQTPQNISNQRVQI